jgi:carbohydrate kinase (thermoresistant glucokinase family)
MVYIVMGISGCGKSTIGKMLAERLLLTFHDADDYHSWGNIKKMRESIPLDDKDRKPWLLNLASHIVQWNKHGGAVLACSALKEKYRQILSQDGNERVTFIYLKGDKEIILNRIRPRSHFFPSNLLETQLNTLEEPTDAITVRIDKPSEEVCTTIIGSLLSKGLALPLDEKRLKNG